MAEPLLERLEQLRARAVAASAWLVCLDYDGTLTELVDRPEQAHVDDQMRAELSELQSLPAVQLAFVSGRGLNDLQARIPLSGAFYAGNHGLEIQGPSCCFVEPKADQLRGRLSELARQLNQELQPRQGIFVEDKGLTLSLHFRLATEAVREQAERPFRELVAAAGPEFLIAPGNRVWEVRPVVPWHKGSAVRWIREQLGQENCFVSYVGDDATDELAFADLPEAITIKVGPPDDTRARYHMPGPTWVGGFLRWLAGFRPAVPPAARTFQA
jgi:trehalose 6-phosphate phosphatase